MVPHPHWHRLDNAGKLFPSVTSARQTHIFRLALNLTSPVEPSRLEAALTSILPRFPLFQCRIHRGFFWYSLVQEETSPPLFPDSSSPCMPFQEKHPHLFRVRWYQKRLAVEFSHALTDGVGASVFFRALVCRYIELGGTSLSDWQDIPRAHETASPEEAEDAVSQLFVKDYPTSSSYGNRALLLPFKLLPRGQYRVITGRMPLDLVLEKAKAHHLTLNEYLTVLYILSFQAVYEDLPSPAQKKLSRLLRIIVPFNLRKLFPTRTLRNFFVVLTLELDLSLGHYSFAEVVRKVHHLLQAEMDEKLILKQVSRNLRGERHPLSRLAPLVLKNLVLSSIFNKYEKEHTSSLSNLGIMNFPCEVLALIESCDFIPPPSPHTKINAGVVSCRGVLSLSLGSMTGNSEVERMFFTQLRKQGIPVKLESNHEALKEI